jgi:beta-ribofuranosylaminobenzene 5'-phosphate synthase
MSDFIIAAPSRIHMNLLSMDYAGYRRNGGLGFAISGWDTQFKFFVGSANDVVDQRDSKLCLRELGALKDFLNVLCLELNLQKRVKVVICAGPTPHSGLGVGTTTKLALAEALMLANGRDYEPLDLIRLSKRGGTSGIGINTYFTGGFILDAGVTDKELVFGPSASRASVEFSIPKVIIKCPMPEWEIGVLQSPAKKIMSGVEEQEFFSKNTPIDTGDVQAACYHAVMGVTSAILDGDYDGFSRAIRNTQILKWKSLEWAEQSSSTNDARNWLESNGVLSVGLSSFGPSLYFTGNRLEGLLGLEFPEVWRLKVVRPDNVGRVVSYV